jgi:hypothetical protein
MVKKGFWLGMLVITLIFGMTVFGCASTALKTNIYNLGDVSEENCALIEVSPVYQIYNIVKNEKIESDYQYSDFVKIDGQGDDKQWQPPPEGLFKNKAIVRVTPGAHTFTITFFFNDEYKMPVDITYDCKAGKGYQFRFVAQEIADWNAAGLFTLDGSKVKFGFVNTTIIILESDVNEKGDFGGFATTSSEAEKKTESFNFHPDWTPNDRERLVKR